MKNFNFKKRTFASGPHFIGLVIIIVGVFVLASPAFLKSENSIEKSYGIGGIAIIIGLLVISTFEGVQIDFSNKKYKEYQAFVGFKFGEWTTLPKIIEVKLISKSYKNTNTPNGISPTLSGKVTDYVASLYTDDTLPLLSFVSSNRAKALKQATYLATHLDATLVQEFTHEK